MSGTISPGTFEIFDTTMRDGDQAQPLENQFPPGTKPDAAAEIAQLGVETIEAGFPATPGDHEQVREVAKTVGNEQYQITPRSIVDGALIDGSPYMHTPIITGLSRAKPGDIDSTWAAVESAARPGIHTFIATDPGHVAVKFPGATQDDIVEMARRAVAHARDISDGKAVVEFSAEAASTTPLAFLERVVKEAMQAGANVVNLPDTLGTSSPMKIRRMFAAVTRWVVEQGLENEVTISTHCHNDFGMATANTLMAVQSVAETAQQLGVQTPRVQAEVVQGGRGERAGNASAEQVIMATLMHADEFGDLRMPRIDTTRIARVAAHVFSTLDMVIPPTAPILGQDTRTHRSGIHSDAIVKGGARIYTPYDPRWVGHPEAAIIAPGGYQGTRGNNNLGAMYTY